MKKILAAILLAVFTEQWWETQGLGQRENRWTGCQGDRVVMTHTEKGQALVWKVRGRGEEKC